MQNTSGGRIIKAEYGWTPPEAMKSMLSQYSGTADNCPRA